MASPNKFLQDAKAICFETPEKASGPKVKVEDGVADSKPGVSAKKPCSSLEKFLKKLPGNTSHMRDPWLLWVLALRGC